MDTARKTPVVSGRLVDPAGGSLATAMVSLFSSLQAEDLKAPVAADGRFRFHGVPAADYMLTVLDTSTRAAGTPPFVSVLYSTTSLIWNW